MSVTAREYVIWKIDGTEYNAFEECPDCGGTGKQSSS